MLVTSICILVSMLLFICSSWLPSPFQALARGRTWVLITSNFVHTEPLHLLFNLYWFWLFGGLIEQRQGRGFYLIMLFSAAMVSSISQLAFSGSNGIGLSGIVYCFFGFMWMRRAQEEIYRQYLSTKIIGLFLVWLVACVFLTRAGILNVGNAAHTGGLLWGMLLAGLLRLKPGLRWVVGSLAFCLPYLLWLYSPTALSRQYLQAYRLHGEGRLPEAKQIYERILSRDTGDEFARGNLRAINIYELEQQAYALYLAQDYEAALPLYHQILKLDPGNTSATENLKSLEEYLQAVVR